MKGSVYKRNGNYYVVIDVGRTPEGKRKQKWFSGFKRKKDAEAELGRILAEVQAGEYREPSKTTVSEFLNQWLETVSPNIRETTLQSYQWAIDRLTDGLGSLEMAKLSPFHIQSHYTAQRKLMGGTSVLYQHKVLRMALRKAQQWRVVAENPADNVTAPKRTAFSPTILDEGQTRRLLSAAESSTVHLPILLAVTCGLRRGEVLGLKWGDLDLERGLMYVRRTVDREKGKTIEKALKTKKSERALAIPRRLASRLEEIPRASDYVCASPTGEPYDPDYLLRAFQKILSRAKLPKMRFHDLRHVHAVQLIAAGVSPRIVSQRLGHSNAGFTMNVYASAFPDLQHVAADAVDRIYH